MTVFTREPAWRGKTARDWLQELGGVEPQGDSASVTSVAAVSRLARTIEQAPRKRRASWRLRVATGAGLGLVAGAALYLGLGSLQTAATVAERPAARLIAIEGEVRVRPAGEVAHDGQLGVALAGSETVTTGPRSRASLELANLARVTLEGDTELALFRSVAAGHDSARLLGGRATLSVPKLAPGAQLSIVTADATVSVVGTRFTVFLRSGHDGPVTCLEVEEGSVRATSSVRQALVGAGERWASRGPVDACREERPAARGGVERLVPASSAAPAASRPTGVARRSPGAPSVSSTLSEENQLYLDVITARRSGDKARALSLAAEFQRRFPTSTLTDAVREERLRAAALP